MTIFRILLAGLLTLSLSCIGHSRTMQAVQPSAEIGSNSARFVFPAEMESTFSWPRQVSGYPVGRYYAWSVRWDPPRAGARAMEIEVSIEDSLEVRGGPLSDLLHDARIEVHYLDRRPTAVDSVVRSAIAVHTERGAVVLTVRGSAAIARLFPVRQDSVTMDIPRIMMRYDYIQLAVRKRR